MFYSQKILVHQPTSWRYHRSGNVTLTVGKRVCNNSVGGYSKYDSYCSLEHEQQYNYANSVLSNHLRGRDNHCSNPDWPRNNGLAFFIAWWHQYRASIHVEYVKDTGRNYERPPNLEVPANSPYLVTINIHPKSGIHLETPRIWIAFPKSVRVIVDFLGQYPRADKNFPLGELNAERNCLLDKEKPPSYDNLRFPKQPTMMEPHLAFYDPYKTNTNLQTGVDHYLWIWVETGNPVEGEIEITVRPTNMTKALTGKLPFSVIESKH